ncbi:MAG: alpha/beta fold hydrolase [Candidatus Micrarchaeia archaeon]
MEQMGFDFKGKRVIYFESDAEQANKILLMHGYSFESSVWDRFGFVRFLKSIGYASFALDVPGFPNSRNKERMPESAMLDMIEALIKNRIQKRPVLLGASASGHLALKFAEQNANSIKAVIAVGPVGLDSINLEKINVPMLGVWGSEDKISDPDDGVSRFESVGALTAILEGAGHACYLDKPEAFVAKIAEFLKSQANE